MPARTRLAPNGASRTANASYVGKAPAALARKTLLAAYGSSRSAITNYSGKLQSVVTIQKSRRTLSQLGTRMGDRQVQANHNG